MKPIKSDFQIKNTFLENLIFKTNLNFASKANPIPLDIDIQVENNKNYEKKEAKVSIIIKVFKNNNGPFSIELKYTGIFKVSDTMSEEIFNKLCSINAPAILMPYARSIITTITAESGFPPLLLPLINIKETLK